MNFKILKVLFICLLYNGLSGQSFADSNTHSIQKNPEAARKETLVFGRVTTRPKKHYKRYKPIVNYVVSKMSDLGIREGFILLAKDNEEMIRYLRKGEVDWVSETVFSAILFYEATGAEIILRRWKKGLPEYHTVFITRQDSGITTLEDLVGKKIAFEDPGSTTGYFVPMAVLKSKGLSTFHLSDLRSTTPSDKIGYFFSKGELNISILVHRGLVAAGAYSNVDWENPNDTPEKLKNDLKIFYKTKPFPRAVELVRKGVDPKIKSRLKEILLNIHNDSEGKKALKAYARTKKFDEFNDRGLSDLEEARKIIEDFFRETK